MKVKNEEKCVYIITQAMQTLTVGIEELRQQNHDLQARMVGMDEIRQQN